MGTVRIIGGLYKGRKLKVNEAEGLRPTTDRVKETLFNWLQFEIPGTRCLDLFSGSGSLSFEALSRNASFVTLIEMNKTSASIIRSNLELLKVNNAELLICDALKFISSPNKSEPYNIVFIDPPFRKGILEQVFDLLNSNGYLCNNALIYVEHEKELQVTYPDNWVLQKSKCAGQVVYNLYKNG